MGKMSEVHWEGLNEVHWEGPLTNWGAHSLSVVRHLLPANSFPM
jgi:hypothetical protein